jgi:hypothetical protein
MCQRPRYRRRMAARGQAVASSVGTSSTQAASSEAVALGGCPFFWALRLPRRRAAAAAGGS